MTPHPNRFQSSTDETAVIKPGKLQQNHPEDRGAEGTQRSEIEPAKKGGTDEHEEPGPQEEGSEANDTRQTASGRARTRQ